MEKIDKVNEEMKEKTFSVREMVRIKTEKIEVSIRAIKRNMASGTEHSKKDIKDSMNKSGNLLQAHKNDNEFGLYNPKTSNTDREEKNKFDNEFKKQQVSDQSSKQNMKAFDLVWEEIDQLRKKFHNYVRNDDFDYLRGEVDEIHE